MLLREQENDRAISCGKENFDNTQCLKKFNIAVSLLQLRKFANNWYAVRLWI